MKPDAGYPQWSLAAAYGFKGDLERARAELAEAKRLWSPHLSVAGFRAKSEWYTPAVRDRWETVIFPGLRAAGLPEE